MAGVTKDVIISDDSFRIVSYRHELKPSKIIVTFDPHGHGLRDKGFGSDLSIKEGYDHIFISHRLNSQYQALSLEIFKQLVLPLVEGYEVYTYGSSLGGYCALYFAGCIGARAIALSPRNSAHPSINDKQFSHVHFTHSEIGETETSIHPPLIIYDPIQDADRRFVRNCILPAYPNAKMLSMPFAGHLIAEALLEIGLLKDFILRIINDDQTSYVDFSKYESSYWNAELGYEKIRTNDLPSAAAFLKKSLLIKNNFLHLDKLISLTRTHRVPFSILYDVIDPYMEILEQSEYFDAKWYIEQNPDISDDGGFLQKPTLHYLLFGGYEGRNPSQKFNSAFYLSEYPDIKAAGANPLLHFIRFGKAEGRKPAADI